MKKIVFILLLILFLTSCNYSSEEAFEKDYDMRFGIGGQIYPFEDKNEIYERTAELDSLGGVWLRHPGKGMTWYEVEEERGSYDFSKMDAIMEENNHPWVMFVYGMVGNVYPFGEFSKEYLGSLNSKEEILSYLIENTLDIEDQEQRVDAENYIREFVGRYKGEIDYWEIGGNEGLPAEGKAEIIIATYPWIKEEDPGSYVVVTAINGDDDNLFYQNLDAFEDLMAKGGGDYFDIANFHYYGNIAEGFDDRLEERYFEYKDILDKYNVHKPIWVTETCTSSSDHGLSGKSNDERQARDLIKRMVVYSSLGAEKVFWYGYGAHQEGDKFYGCSLLDNNGNPKPAYYNFKLLVEKLGYYDSVEIVEDDNVRLYKFLVEGEEIYVGWTESGEEEVDLGDVIVTYILEEKGDIKPEKEFVYGKFMLSESPVFVESLD